MDGTVMVSNRRMDGFAFIINCDVFFSFYSIYLCGLCWTLSCMVLDGHGWLYCNNVVSAIYCTDMHPDAIAITAHRSVFVYASG